MVPDRETGHAIPAPDEDRTRLKHPRLERDKADRRRHLAAGPDAGQIPRDKADRLGAAVDREFAVQVEQAQRREQAAEPEHMIEMHMRQQNVGETAEAGAGAQQLALRPLAAINQETLAAGAHQQAGRPRSVEGVVAAVPRKVSSNMPQ